MKTAYNIVGNLPNLLSAINAGNVSLEAAQLQSCFLYYWQDVTYGSWAFTDAGYSIAVRTPMQGNPTVTFDGTSLQFEKPTVQTQTGAQDSKATIVCYPNTDAPNLASTVNTFFSGANSGLFDGGWMWIFRLITSKPMNVSGIVKEYGGWIGMVKASRDKMTIELNSIFQQLNLRLPKRTYSPACTHALFDFGCGVKMANWTFSLSISSVDPNFPQQLLHTTGYPSSVPTNSFNLGKAQFTSGLNTGLVRGIKQDYQGLIWLTSTLPNTPNPGDVLSVSAGCDKTITTCTSKFNNFPNFNGFPFIPQESIFY